MVPSDTLYRFSFTRFRWKTAILLFVFVLSITTTSIAYAVQARPSDEPSSEPMDSLQSDQPYTSYLPITLKAPPAPAPVPAADMYSLPITFPINSPDVAVFFNQIARQNDQANFPESQFSYIDHVYTGEHKASFKAWSDAETQLSNLPDTIDWISYNSEGWDQTPQEEKDNLPEVVKKAAEQVHAEGMLFMWAPDRRFADAHIGEVAPYIDAVVFQVQKLQYDTAKFTSWVYEHVEIARAANPDLIIFVQVSATQGPADEMYAAIRLVANQIDGIAVWSQPDTLSILKEFVEMVR